MSKKLYLFAVFVWVLLMASGLFAREKIRDLPGLNADAGPNPFPYNDTFTLSWNGFYGGSGIDFIKDVAVAADGSLYAVGQGEAGFGSPIRPHSGAGQYDVLVARFSADGALVWHTYLGAAAEADKAARIVLDASGHVTVLGRSIDSWGSPLNPIGGDHEDYFVARLDRDGQLLWHTFLGATRCPHASDVFVTSGGKILVAGSSISTFGTPLTAHQGGYDCFLLQMDQNGNWDWLTFMGGANYDSGGTVCTDSNGNIFFVGASMGNWGDPISPNTVLGSNYCSFLARVEGDGTLIWHTFIPSTVMNIPYRVALDAEGNPVIAGNGYGSFGDPIRSYGGLKSGFVMAYSSLGQPLWNTFLGNPGDSQGISGANKLAIGRNGTIYVSGFSNSLWGHAEKFFGMTDYYIAKLNARGALLGNVLYGTAANDITGVEDHCFALDARGRIVTVGGSVESWGIPINAAPAGGDCQLSLAVIEENEIQLRNADSGHELPGGSTFSFAEVLLGESKSAGIDILSMGSGILRLGGSPVVTIEGKDAAEFQVISQPSDRIEPGQTSRFSLAFSPGSIGRKEAYFIIISNDPNESRTRIDLIGEAKGLTLGGTVRQSGGEALPHVVLKGGSTACATALDGQYSLALPYRWSGRVVPELSGWYILPEYRDYAELCESVENQDYTAHPVSLLLRAEQKTIRTATIRRHYAEITVLLEKPDLLSQYRVKLFKRTEQGDFALLADLQPSAFMGGRVILKDMAIETGGVTIYQAVLYNSVNSAIVQSPMETL